MDDNIAFQLGQVARLMRRDFDERARQVGVTRPQWQVISLLSHSEGINQCGLADILEVEPITLGRMIDRMQDAELVERRPDPTDRRAWRLYLTDKSRDLGSKLRLCGQQTHDLALEGLDREARTRLTAIMDRMRSNLSRKSPVAPEVTSSTVEEIAHG